MMSCTIASDNIRTAPGIPEHSLYRACGVRAQPSLFRHIAALVGNRKSLCQHVMSASSVGIALPSLEHAASAYAGSVDKPSSHSDDSSLSHGFEFEQRSDGDIRWVFAPVTLGPSITQSVSDIRSKILPFVRPRWKPQSLGHRVFEEGVSNRLIGFYEITGDPDEAEDIVLVRINGEGREAFIDSRTEILVMLTLHREGLSPPVYLVAENAICYGYIPGTTLSADDYQVWCMPAWQYARIV